MILTPAQICYIYSRSLDVDTSAHLLAALSHDEFTHACDIVRMLYAFKPIVYHTRCTSPRLVVIGTQS